MDSHILIQKFDKQAKSYGRNSRKKGLDWRWREKLLQSAHGKILELSVGAGKNFRLYPKTAHLTAVDFSPKMIEKAKENASYFQLNVNFIISSVEELSFPVNTFDTIVSTLSFCAYDDPVAILKKVQNWCKPEGQILLMEHGRSSVKLAGWIQDHLDGWQYRTAGCHPNRDMMQIITKSRLHIEQAEHTFFNSVHLVWAKPGRDILRVDISNT
jgi:ubiquinone/menaquinone biosynthesis C-methylase UbiE